MIKNLTDRALVDLLRRNARLSISDLARQLGVSRTTAQQRLRRLEDSGVIRGYTALLGDEYREAAIRAHVNLAIEPRANARVVASLEQLPEVETLYSVSGKVDLIALVSCQSAADLDRCLDNIAAIAGVLSTETSVILSTRLERGRS